MNQDELIAKLMHAYKDLLEIGIGKHNHEPCISIETLEKALESDNLFDVTYLSWSGCSTLAEAFKSIDDFSREELGQPSIVRFHTEIKRTLSYTVSVLKISRIRAQEANEEAAHLPEFEDINFLPLFQRRGLVSFVNNVEKSSDPQIAPFKIVIFGSYATGKAERWSDLDIAVVANRFNGISWQKRINILRKLLPSDGSVINPLGITPEEYKEKIYPSILRSIRQGKMIYH